MKNREPQTQGKKPKYHPGVIALYKKMWRERCRREITDAEAEEIIDGFISLCDHYSKSDKEHKKFRVSQGSGLQTLKKFR